MRIQWLAPSIVLPGLHTEPGEEYEVPDAVGAACIAAGLAAPAPQTDPPDEGEE